MDQPIEDAVTRWRDAGIIDERAARAIRRFEESRAGPGQSPEREASSSRGRAGVLAEGLAYLGAALASGAGFALFSELWAELGGLTRTLTAAGGTLALGGGAAALGRASGQPAARLRSLLAALAVVGVALTVGVGLTELTSIGEESIATMAGAAALLVVVPVHLTRPSWPTALVAGSAVLTTALAGEAALGWEDEVWAGTTMAVIGLVWAGLGWLRVLRPRAAFEVPGLLVLGFGIQVLAFEAFPVAALVLGLAVAVAVLAAGTVEARTSLGVLGALGVTAFAPQLVFELFGETVGGPLALFVGSLALVVGAVLVLRRRGAP